MNAVAESDLDAPRPVSKPRRPGSVLRDERRTQGLSIDEVGAELRLPPRYVNALEMGEYSKLPGNTFARGYIRNYAAFLDIDPAPLLEAFDRSARAAEQTSNGGDARKRKTAVKPVEEKRDGVSLWVIAGVAAALVLGAWLSGAFQSSPDETGSMPLPSQTSDTTAAEGGSSGELVGSEVTDIREGAASGSIQTEGGASETLVSSMTSGPAPVTASSEADASEASIVTADSALAGEAASVSAAGGEGALVIEFSEDCWLRIRDAAGKNLAFGVRKAGETLTLDSGAPFNVLIGNVAGVTVRYKGEPVDLDPYREKNVAKFTLN